MTEAERLSLRLGAAVCVFTGGYSSSGWDGALKLKLHIRNVYNIWFISSFISKNTIKIV